MKTKNVAIIMGKKEEVSFNRYTFPILTRPVATYPILAALNSEKIDQVFLSTDAPNLLELGKNIENINLLKREQSQPTLTEEVRNALRLIIEKNGEIPETICILLANSPCVTSEMLTNGISLLERNRNLDSVVSAMQREEFDPQRIFSLKNNLLEKQNYVGSKDVYFLDRRMIIIRSKIVIESTIKTHFLESILGNNIHPIIQNDGIWDIDYIWQVPLVERWLKQNGFSESETPYTSIQTKEQNKKSVKQKEYSAKSKFRVLITTVPFGEIDPLPLKLLDKVDNIEYTINPIGRKLKEDELFLMVPEYDILIAGTEQITRKVLENGGNLKLISRVGIGLDSVDLNAAQEFGIKVSYTPDAPAPAVSELAMGHMLNLLRRLPLVDRNLRSGVWHRVTGRRLANMTIGIIGTGRIGSRILKHLQGFHPKRILVNDLNPNYDLYDMFHAEHVDKEIIYKEADIITIHVPLTPTTKSLISSSEMSKMKESVLLINTSRGGIINESDLYTFLSNKKIGGAAIDVFEKEPYSGNLIELDNCILSCHMGSMSEDCRARMEIEATEDAIRFVNGESLKQPAPQYEYVLQSEFKNS